MGKIVGLAKLSSKNQITIPKAVRDIIGLGHKSRVVFYEESGKIFIRSDKE